jgi:hypothetical protein
MVLPLLLCLLLQQPPLTQAEKDLLDAPFREGLFDPAAAKAQRVRGTITLRTCYGKKKSMEASGWLVPAAPDRHARFVLNSLQEVASLENAASIPFPNTTFDEESKIPSFSDIGIFKEFTNAQSFLWAAWTHRLGRDEDAARLLRSLKAEGLLDRFRAACGWELFSDAINAFIVAEDADALAAVERLVKFESPYRKQGEELRRELLRRQKAGTFGKPGPPLPRELASLPLPKRIEALISVLDFIAPDKHFSDSQDLNAQPVAQELVSCGEAAVPALLQCLEVDTRLTRSVGVWREWSPHRTILSVRVASCMILGTILRTRRWDPHKEIPWLDQENPDSVGTWNKAIRHYWEEFGATPFPERMMRILTDPLSTLDVIHETSENLARLDRTPGIGLQRYYVIPPDDTLVRKLRPELATFKSPTVAEGILEAMDRHMKAVAFTGNWAEINEKDYLIYVGELGDSRIGPELRARYEKSTNPKTRHRLAFALRRLGETGPIEALARAVDRGTESIYDAGDALEIVDALGRSKIPPCEAVLSAFARKDHPWHKRAKDGILEGGSDQDAWVAHPYCLSLLRGLLQDESTTGAIVVVEGGRDIRQGTDSDGFRYYGGPALPGVRKDRAVERVCDQAAYRLSGLIPDAPSYHPLLTDADTRLKELRIYIDRNVGHFRRMTRAETAARELPWWGVHWVVGR